MEPRTAVGFLMLLVLLPQEARPQEVTSLFADLGASGVLKPGDTVYVTDARGERSKGRVTDLSTTSLTLTVGSDTRDLSGMNITKIERRDSLENGIWIGLGIGVGMTTVACKVDPDPEHCPYIVGYFGLPAMAAGTILGAIVDASVRRTLYLAPGGITSSRVTFSPILSNAHKGLLLSVAF